VTCRTGPVQIGRRRVALAHRFGLDVFFPGYLGDRSERRHFCLKIGNVEKAGLVQTNIDKRGLHTRQYPRYLTFVDIADETLMLLALEIEFSERPILEHRHACFKCRGINHDLALHMHSSSRIAAVQRRQTPPPLVTSRRSFAGGNARNLIERSSESDEAL